MDVDLRLPWKLVPLKGKHYGTLIANADGECVVKVWTTGRTDNSAEEAPSARQQAQFPGYTPDRSWDYISDTHYECERDYATATAIVEKMNAHD